MRAGFARRLSDVRQLARAELRSLTTIQHSDRLWQMAFAAALATGAPLLVGAWFGRIQYGLVSAIGGVVFLHLPHTPLYHRMVTLMACAFTLSACYTLGLFSHFVPVMVIPTIIFVAISVTLLVRFYSMGPPAGLFFIMAASIGAYTPVQALDVPLMVGLVTMGGLLATLIAFCYSLFTLRVREPDPVPRLRSGDFDYVILDSVMIGAFVGLALAAAHVLQLPRPYWVAVSCVAVIQGVSVRAIWRRQLHRVLGTGIGLVVAGGILTLPLNPWSIALTMIALTFIVELTVVRHYAFAVVFITPMTLLLAESSNLGAIPPAELMRTRFFDTVLGCVVGLVGGLCLHDARFREVVRRIMRQST